MSDATGAATQEALTMLFSGVFDGDDLRIQAALRQLEFLDMLAKLAQDWGAKELGAMAIDNELVLASRPGALRELERAAIGEGPGALAMVEGR